MVFRDLVCAQGEVVCVGVIKSETQKVLDNFHIVINNFPVGAFLDNFHILF